MNFLKEKWLRTPTDILFYFYNFSVALFILINFAAIKDSFLLIISHLIIVFLYFYTSSLNYNLAEPQKLNNYVKIFFVISSLTFLHYESGLINLVVFPEYFDASIRALDIKIFGRPLYKIAAKFTDNTFLVQIFHFFYMTYYLLLLIPVMLIYRKQSQETVAFSGQAEESLFLLLFTMFVCYWIFIIFPVIGPTETHYEIFNDQGGFVKIVNYFYKYGDSAGGAMPSSHVSVSLVVTLFSFKHLKKIAPYILFTFVMLTLSTVFCSFHYAIDSIAGIGIGFCLYYLGKAIHKKLKQKLEG